MSPRRSRTTGPSPARQLTLIAPDPTQAWVSKIQAAWQKSVTAILETGRVLIDAKDELPRGAFLAMVQLKLPFNRITAYRLMTIAGHPILTNVSHVKHLPPSWGTLYELTRLDETVLLARIEDGTINPKMERKHVAELREPGPKLPKQPRLIDPVDRCTMAVRSLVLDAARGMPSDRWGELFAALRDELADCEKTAAKHRGAE
jgi:hypothetical protein